jgi:hypothetical protein
MLYDVSNYLYSKLFITFIFMRCQLDEEEYSCLGGVVSQLINEYNNYDK